MFYCQLHFIDLIKQLKQGVTFHSISNLNFVFDNLHWWLFLPALEWVVNYIGWVASNSTKCTFDPPHPHSSSLKLLALHPDPPLHHKKGTG